MRLSHFLSIYFDTKVRQRGSSYFKQTLVTKITRSANSFNGTVLGRSGSYSVSLKWTLDFSHQRFVGICTCPHFEKGDFCKHLWAAILAFETIPPLVSFPFNSTLISLIHEQDDSVDNALPKPALERRAPVAKKTSAGLQSLQQLEQLRIHLSIENTTSSTYGEKVSLKHTGEVWYFISISQSIENQKLTLYFYHRTQLDSGKLGKMKPLSLAFKEIDLIPLPEDRRFLETLLVGTSSEIHTSYYYSGYGVSRYSKSLLPQSLQDWLLPQLAASGRLSVMQGKDLREYEPLPPVSFDDRGPFRLDASMEFNSENAHWKLKGKLKRESNGVVEELDPKKITPFLTDLFWRGNTLCHLESSRVELFLIEQLAKDTPFIIPQKEAPRFIEKFYKLPGFPMEILPEEIRFQEVFPPLKLRIQLSRQKSVGSSDPDFEGVLFFDYEGKVYPASQSKESAHVDPEKRQVSFRNQDEEAQAIQILRTLGFREYVSFNKPPSWILPKKLFSKVVLELCERGWDVKLEKEKIVRPQDWHFSITSEVDWFDLAIKIDFEGTSVGLPEVLEALQRGEHFLTLADGSQALLSKEWLNRYAGLLQLGKKSTKGKVRYSSVQAMLVNAFLEKEAHLVVDLPFQEILKKMRSFEGIDPKNPPPTFQGTLRDYQKEGLGWFDFLKEFGFGGCLADDMGLGKTIQVLAFLEENRIAAKEKNPPTLVVVPRSLVYNWLEESRRFTPQLKTLDYTGVQRSTLFSFFHDYDLIVTTYGTLRRDLEKMASFEFQFLILDEAQAIKNASSQIAKIVKRIPSRYRLAMTGTPVENHLGELWSLFEFLNPGLLGTVSHFQQFSKNQSASGEAVQLLAKGIKPFILRRTKSEVLKELPAKTEQTLFCELSSEQKKLYEELKLFYQSQLAQKIEADGIAKNKIQILEALLRLRQVACHPGLVDTKRKGESSAKLETLLEQLKEILEEGHRVLVFSQFTKFLEIVQKSLDAEKIVYEYLDGKTKNRQAKVDRFQNDPDCSLFLISLKAGGFGLNLTAADYVFLLDPWWNPAVEAQAIDRAHRMGQSKPVFAYRLIAKGTIEEKILELQASKKELAEGILSGSTSLIRQLTKEDLEFLLG